MIKKILVALVFLAGVARAQSVPAPSSKLKLRLYAADPFTGTSASGLWMLTDGTLYKRYNGSSSAVGGGSGSITPTDITITSDSLGTAQTPKLTLTNTTAAAAGAQQYSGMLELIGRGWKTASTAASQEVKIGMQLRPVQGSSAPTGELVFFSSINGGAYAEKFKIDTNGNLTLSGSASTITGSTANATVTLDSGSGSALRYGSGNVTTDTNGDVKLNPINYTVSGGGWVHKRTAVNDVDKTVALTDTYVGYTAIAAARVVTLPTSPRAGTTFIICDESGSASGGNTITLTRGGSDTINGATTLVINTAYGCKTLVANGAGKYVAY